MHLMLFLTYFHLFQEFLNIITNEMANVYLHNVADQLIWCFMLTDTAITIFSTVATYYSEVIEKNLCKIAQ